MKDTDNNIINETKKALVIGDLKSGLILPADLKAPPQLILSPQQKALLEKAAQNPVIRNNDPSRRVYRIICSKCHIPGGTLQKVRDHYEHKGPCPKGVSVPVIKRRP